MKMLGNQIFLLALALLIPAIPAEGNVKVRLLTEAEAARPGDTVMAALEMRMAPAWHTYWRNPGESGMATTIEWELPEGIVPGEIQWPIPEKYNWSGLTTFVYHDKVLLLAPLHLADDLRPGPVELKAAVSWLECEELCLPGDDQVQARLIIGNERRPSEHAAAIQTAKTKLPEPGADLEAAAFWETNADMDRPLRIEWPTDLEMAKADFFPYEAGDFEVAGRLDQVVTGPGNVVFRKFVNRFGDAWPERIAGLLVANPGRPDQRAFVVEFAIQDGTAAVVTGAAPTQPGVGPVYFGPERPIVVLLFFAFLGGLILNIMPCVLPVVALKILGFVNQSHAEPRRVRELGLIFGLGVLVSFLGLASVAIAVQRAGELAGWGIQMQNPQFLLVMTVLLTLVALNLFGLFEINLGGKTMGAATVLASKEGRSGAFFNGVLVTALATPCTAPFLATAVGAAFSQPPPIIILFFLAIGLGLAAPYVLLSFKPQWLKFLPRPGAWMEKFKVAMGFPMLGTAIWLFWLSNLHYGSDGTLWIGLFLVVLGLAAWVWGEFVQRARRYQLAGMGASLLLVFSAYALILESELQWRSDRERGASMIEQKAGSDGIPWQPWSAEAVNEARAAGRPVLVDFTADWCLTCKVNERLSINIPEVRAKLEEVNAVALLADWSNRDPVISAELRRFNRAGVPLVVVYSPEPDREPLVLPTTLTPGIVLRALEDAAPARITSVSNFEP